MKTTRLAPDDELGLPDVSGDPSQPLEHELVDVNLPPVETVRPSGVFSDLLWSESGSEGTISTRAEEGGRRTRCVCICCATWSARRLSVTGRPSFSVLTSRRDSSVFGSCDDPLRTGLVPTEAAMNLGSRATRGGASTAHHPEAACWRRCGGSNSPCSARRG